MKEQEKKKEVQKAISPVDVATDSNKKYQIFISSSYEDLLDERKAIIDEILKAENIPAGMESFVAGNDADLKVIEKAIDQSDIYVILVGARYGSVVSRNQNKSFTEIEFEYAKGKGKPILAFLLDDGSFDKIRNDLPKNHEDKRYEGELRRFREEVKKIEGGEKHRIVGFFGPRPDGIKQLANCFIGALYRLINNKEFNARGWVRGDIYERFRLPREIDQNEFMQRIVKRLCRFDVLSKRCTNENPSQKKAMATYFWDRYLARLTDSKIRRIFFESGSTIAYLSQEFENRLESPCGQKHQHDWQISTNNILTYLQLVLFKNLHLQLLPYGPPELKYGATFGKLTELPGYPPPNTPEENTITSSALKEVDKLAKDLSDNKPKIFLATASGLELDEKSGFLGFHVGSYYNRLFKLSIFRNTNKHPVVVFLDDSKVGRSFKVGHCHPISYVNEDQMTWESICQDIPLALCIGAKSEKKWHEYAATLKKYGFKHAEPLETDDNKCFPLIIKNDKFEQYIKKVSVLTRKGK